MIRTINFNDIDLDGIPVSVKMNLNSKQRELADYVVSELRKCYKQVSSAVYAQAPTYSDYLEIDILTDGADEDTIIEMRTFGAEIVSDILVDYGYMMLVGVYENQPELV
ncbi:MAG: hypothetical protein MUF71_18130 [Candidatus Kapabacteria bacterium]|jgi:hypothetical protein|nr:hypothetical protein [Candidatus Kapabacteria bacterium]